MAGTNTRSIHVESIRYFAVPNMMITPTNTVYSLPISIQPSASGNFIKKPDGHKDPDQGL